MRTKKVLFIFLLLVFILLTSGCSGGFFNKKPIIGSTPGTTAKVDLAYTYEIIATDPDGDTLTYALVEKPDGMTINQSTGVVSWTPGEDQIGGNQVEIEVSDGKKSVFQTFTINVEEPSLSSIVVVPSTMSIYIGDSEPITSITAHYDNETTVVIELDSDDVSYNSDDEDIATVSELGVVTGESVGTATITVSYTEGDITKTDTISVTVQKEPTILTAISVKPDFMIIYKGPEYSESINSITAYYDNGTTASIELSSATYVSNDDSVAIVNKLGVVTGASEGTATITVIYTEDGIARADSVDVEVREVP